MFCKNCGSENPSDAKFCAGCGSLLDATQGTQANSDNLKKYDSIGGWLILVAIGIVFLPLRILANIGENDKFLENSQATATFPKLTQVIQNDIKISYILLILSVCLLYLFFAKKSIFPKFFIGYLVFNICMVFLKIYFISGANIELYTIDVGKKISSELAAESFKSVATSFVSALIWIPYMLLSKRVKGTFIK